MKERFPNDFKTKTNPKIKLSDESALSENAAVLLEHSEQLDLPILDDRFELLEKVGEGAMGVVWKVFDRSINRTLALKLLRPELLSDEAAVNRLLSEAELSSVLDHPNIATVYGYGRDKNNRPYLIMDFVEGETLSSLLKREGPIDEERALNIFVQVSDALSHAHMMGIIHRDIKPSNILIANSGSNCETVKVVDFGIARSIHEDGSLGALLTRPVGNFATPTYMSPEQCLGRNVKFQSDVYSLACVLYEMLTGKPPFLSDNQVQVIVQHLTAEPDLRMLSNRAVGILLPCLLKDPLVRPSSISHITRWLDSSHASSLFTSGQIENVFFLLFGVLVLCFALLCFHARFSLLECICLLQIVSIMWFCFRMVALKTILLPSFCSKFEASLFWSMVSLMVITLGLFISGATKFVLIPLLIIIWLFASSSSGSRLYSYLMRWTISRGLPILRDKVVPFLNRKPLILIVCLMILVMLFIPYMYVIVFWS